MFSIVALREDCFAAGSTRKRRAVLNGCFGFKIQDSSGFEIRCTCSAFCIRNMGFAWGLGEGGSAWRFEERENERPGGKNLPSRGCRTARRKVMWPRR